MNFRILEDGTVRGLWSDDIDWPALGRVSVRRASHVEFDARRQLWTVREARRCNAFDLLLRPAKRWLGGDILFRAHRREEALAWERAWFGPGGAGWPTARSSGGDVTLGVPRSARTSRNGVEFTMSILQRLRAGLFGWLRPPQRVRDHDRQQAYGPRWSRHRPRRIERYSRRRPRTWR